MTFNFEFNFVLEELQRYFYFYNLNRDYEVIIKKTNKFGVLDIVEV